MIEATEATSSFCASCGIAEVVDEIKLKVGVGIRAHQHQAVVDATKSPLREREGRRI